MKSFSSVLITALLLAGVAYPQQESRLTAFDGNTDDVFGSAVAISGNWALVGAPGKDVWPYFNRGTVYAFNRNSGMGQWTFRQYLDGDGHGSSFGTALSMDSDYAIVGAPDASVLDSVMQGCAYVLRRNSLGTYQMISWLVAADGESGDHFGTDVSISGDRALVGARGDNDNGPSSGSAYIFHWNGTEWIQEAKLLAADGREDQRFGVSVSLAGDYALVGANPSFVSDTLGAAYVFKRDGGRWVQQAKLRAPDGFRMDGFGQPVGIDSQYAIIGASRDDDRGTYAGSAYVFRRGGENWTFQTKLTADNGVDHDFFGCSVSLRNGQAAIGAHHGGSTVHTRGSAYIFKRDGEVWSQKAEISASDGSAGNYFGLSVALHGDEVIVGAPRGDRTPAIPGTGVAYVYSDVSSGHLSLAPSSVEFGDVLVGDYSSRSVTVENKGFADLHVTSVRLTGAGATHFAVDTTSFTLTHGEKKILMVTFTPPSVGIFSANIWINSDGGASVTPMSGKGSSTLSVSPDTLDFGAVLVGGMGSIDVVRITNLGSTQIRIDTAYIRQITGGIEVFHMSPRGPFLLDPGTHDDIQVTFSPQGGFSYLASLRVVSGADRDSAILTGIGNQVGIPSVVPDTLRFGDVLLGQRETDTLFVGNNGVFPLAVGPVTYSGEGSGYFSSTPSSFTLAGGEIQPVVVGFTPLAGRSFHVLLHTNTDAGDETVHLLGTGVPAGVLDFTPGALDFGDLRVGTGAVQTVYIRNGGLVDLHVGPITIAGSDPSDFSADATSFTLSPRYVHRLRVGFAARSVGSFSAVLHIASDGGTVEVPLDGNGIGCTPALRTLIGPDDFQQTSGFGRSAAVSGVTLIIGSNRSLTGSETGAAYVFRCDAGGWSQQAKLSPPNADPNDDFGHSVDISGHHAIVGDPAHNDTGAAYVFTYRGGLFGSWELADTLKPTLSSSYHLDHFGQAVAIDGDFAVVGAPNTPVGIVRDVGVAYAYRAVASPGIGGWHLQDSLIASDAYTNLRFGYSVDISGDVAIIGTMGRGAYIFQRGDMITGTRWLQSEKLTSSDHQDGDYFGSPVAIDGDYALVAAPFKPVMSRRGAVYVFKRAGIHWIEVAKITSPYPSAGEEFGTTIALNGDLALIGGLSDVSFYLFRRVSDKVWTHLGTIDTSPRSGGYVALDANTGTGVIGFSWSTFSGYQSGSALVLSGLPVTAIEGPSQELPAAYQLHQNYPNPFNPTTTVRYDLPGASDVRLVMYDLLGQEVAVLAHGRQKQGTHKLTFDASNLASGVYFLRLTAGEFIQTRKIMVIR
jgi:hypothetical protein